MRVTSYSATLLERVGGEQPPDDFGLGDDVGRAKPNVNDSFEVIERLIASRPVWFGSGFAHADGLHAAEWELRQTVA